MADYKVVKGDNLSKLAKKFNTTVDALAALNNIKNKNLIKIGQTLKLPGAAQADSGTSTPAADTPASGGTATPATGTPASGAAATPAAGTPASGGTTTPAAGTSASGAAAEQPSTDWKKQINEMFDNSLKAQQNLIDANYNTQKSDYEHQASKAPEKFNPLRNEAYMNNAMAERSRKESMANMGLSGAGGMSQTLQQRNTSALLNTLGDISRQQQDFTDNINLALGKLTTQYNADTESLKYQNGSDRGRALLDQGNWEKSYGLQQGQLDLSRSDSEFNREIARLDQSNWEKSYGLQQGQLELSRNDSEFSRYMSLYDKKLITKKQMRDKFPQYR